MRISLGPRTIKRIRKRLGYSQKDMAEFCGVAIRTISRWETGHSTPRPKHDMWLRRWL
jgi:transcriptional regulator with XRE-family HTH domain